IPSSPPPGAGCDGSAPKRLYKRVDDETTVAVSESRCERVVPVCSGAGNDKFKHGSADGSVVFFLSPRQLTDSDIDGATVEATASTTNGSNVLTSVTT